jgi:hypothetical protein
MAKNPDLLVPPIHILLISESCPLADAFNGVIGSNIPSPSVIKANVLFDEGTPIFNLSFGSKFYRNFVR